MSERVSFRRSVGLPLNLRCSADRPYPECVRNVLSPPPPSRSRPGRMDGRTGAGAGVEGHRSRAASGGAGYFRPAGSSLARLLSARPSVDTRFLRCGANTNQRTQHKSGRAVQSEQPPSGEERERKNQNIRFFSRNIVRNRHITKVNSNASTASELLLPITQCSST